VPQSAAEFYEGLTQRFEYRDGMYFLAHQVDEYDKKKQTVSELKQLELIVRDEHSAIQWLRQQLTRDPSISRTSSLSSCAKRGLVQGRTKAGAFRDPQVEFLFL